MKKKLFAAMTAAVISITATASIQGLSASADQTQDNASQETVLNYVLTELGITDYDAWIDALSQQVTRDNDNPLDGYVFVDLSPGDIGFPITPYDASVVLMFLSGQVDYAYDYNDMDANGDHIVDKADAQAYLQCATLAMLFDDLEFTIFRTERRGHQILLDHTAVLTGQLKQRIPPLIQFLFRLIIEDFPYRMRTWRVLQD